MYQIQHLISPKMCPLKFLNQCRNLKSLPPLFLFPVILPHKFIWDRQFFLNIICMLPHFLVLLLPIGYTSFFPSSLFSSTQVSRKVFDIIKILLTSNCFIADRPLLFIRPSYFFVSNFVRAILFLHYVIPRLLQGIAVDIASKSNQSSYRYNPEIKALPQFCSQAIISVISCL